MRWISCGLACLIAMAASLTFGGQALAASTTFVGDYSTGDFSQWNLVHNSGYRGPGGEFVPTYSATIVRDDTRGMAARFEVRAGDVLSPSLGGGERSEVMAGNETGGTEGEIRWYQSSTKFDPSFPQNHADLGWGFTNQFWGATGAGPPVGWSVGERNGYWSLVVQPQSQPAAYLQRRTLFDTPLDVGSWHDVTMQIRWSASDSVGWIKLWLNGERQTFVDGSDTYHVRTLIPGARSVRYKEGYYRHQAPQTPTGVVFHTGFRSGPGEPPL